MADDAAQCPLRDDPLDQVAVATCEAVLAAPLDEVVRLTGGITQRTIPQETETSLAWKISIDPDVLVPVAIRILSVEGETVESGLPDSLCDAVNPTKTTDVHDSSDAAEETATGASSTQISIDQEYDIYPELYRGRFGGILSPGCVAVH